MYSRQYFVINIPNKREFQLIAFDHSSDINFQHFLNLYKIVLQSQILFLVIDFTYPACDTVATSHLNLI